MLALINIVIKRTVDAIIALLDQDKRLDTIAENATAEIADRISDSPDTLRKVAAKVDLRGLAEEVGAEDIAGAIDMYDLAGAVDMSDLAEAVQDRMDMDELAERVAYHMKPVSPAPDEPTVTPSKDLIDKMLERAVEMLLEKADEAARNGEL